MEYHLVQNCFVLFLLVASATCATLQLRTKRIDQLQPLDKTDEKSKLVRRKRIEQFGDDSKVGNNKNKNFRTKRIDHEKAEVLERGEIKTKNIDTTYTMIQNKPIVTPLPSTREQSFVKASTDGLSTVADGIETSTDALKMSINLLKTSTTKSETIDDDENGLDDDDENELDPQMNEIESNNDINNLRESVLGSCRGQKFNRTYSSPDCEDVTIETLICGGICEPSPTQLFTDYFNFNDNENAYDACTFCGPQEYEEKLIFFQCHSGNVKRRRWKLKVRKIYTPKACGCIKDSCAKLNMVSHEQHQQNSFFKR